MNEDEKMKKIMDLLFKAINDSDGKALDLSEMYASMGTNQEAIHRTDTPSKAIPMIVKQAGLSRLPILHSAMEKFAVLGAMTDQEDGIRISSYAILAAFLSALMELIRTDDEKFAKALISDLHAVIVGEKWPILSCVQVEQEE